MTGRDDFDRALAGWFEADALAPAPAAGLERILDVTRRQRPRPVRTLAFARSPACDRGGRRHSSLSW